MFTSLRSIFISAYLVVTFTVTQGDAFDCNIFAGPHSTVSKMGRYSDCAWFGSSPFCGSSDKKLSDSDEDGQLVAWTNGVTIDGLCKTGYGYQPVMSGGCCDNYGLGCGSGYKRLFCKKTLP
ncbi:MAG: hypothetical protein BYD32DRAFT_408101 [Podila humilis]|nr:MAG: hypothetical protein BYD32DRAFT_408101 [Podila humilis]